MSPADVCGPASAPTDDPQGDPKGDPDGAFVERRRIAGVPGGPLAGLSFAVKDNVAVGGMAYTSGHPLYAGTRADRTAPAVQRLLDAGAEFIGMTTTDAGGFGATTPGTANPVLPGRTVGGSSGGSAAAVARGHCDFAVGTDTGGSVRIPAACTGLAAFKPTMGGVPCDGVFPLARSMDHVGIIARDTDILVRAGTALLSAAGTAPPAGAPLRLAVERDDGGLWQPEVAASFSAAVDRLRAAGHRIEYVAIPDRRAVAHAHGLLVLSEAAPVYAGLAAEERERLGEAAKRALRYAETFDPAALADAAATRDGLRRRVDALLEDVDLVLSPTLPILPPATDARRVPFGTEEVPPVVALTALTCLANLTGHPAVALPTGGNPPGSIQLLAARGADIRLLSFARMLAPLLREAA